MMAASISGLQMNVYKESDLGSMPESLIDRIAQLYVDVFADPPWNEHRMCAQKHYLSKTEADLDVCPKCKGALEMAYTVDGVKKALFEEVGHQDGGRLVVFTNDDKVSAFGWGFVCSKDELAAKFTTDTMQDLCRRAVQDYVVREKLFYISETVVATSARRQGLATKIVTQLAVESTNLGVPFNLRTHDESPMVQIARRLGMEQVMFKKDDTERGMRVMFAKRI